MKTFAILALLVAAPAAAQTQVDINGDANREWRAADAALNARYKALLQIMRQHDASRADDLRKGYAKPDGDPGYAAQLLAAQRAWLAYRDAQCTLSSFEFRGGSAQGMSRALCLADRTRKRTAELKVFQESLMPK